MKFTAVGDALCQRRLPEDYEGFGEIRDFIGKGDARFFNLETTVHREGECYACQHSGGTYVRCEPELMEDMLAFGFNLTTLNNNHAMDFDHRGMEKSLEYVSRTGIVHAGMGLNMGKAAAPAYLETKNGRVALIALQILDVDALQAGEASRRFPGRPGVCGIRISKKLLLPEEEFNVARRIGEMTGINTPTQMIRNEGYVPALPEGVCEIGQMQCIKSAEWGVKTTCNAEDVARVKKSIEEAGLVSDYVLLSIHTHNIEGDDKANVPAFFRELCRELIDAGADAIVGHGPHLLREIEVYKKKPIFYSLGDFLIQLYQVPAAPEDFYAKYGLNSDSTVISLLKTRSAGFTRGLMEDNRMLEAVIPYWETDEEKNLTHLELLPIRAAKGCGKHLEGLPQVAKDDAFMDRFAKRCQKCGVEIEKIDGKYLCRF